MEINERIRFVMDKEGLNAKDFSEILGVQRSSISHLVSGRNKPSIDFLYKFIESFPKYSPIWLITGKGGVLNEEGVNKSEKESKGISKIIQHSLFEQANVQDSVHDKNKVEKKQSFFNNKTENKEEVTLNTNDIETERRDETKVTNVNRNIDKKNIERVMVFYNDGTFDIYVENKKYD